MLTYLEPCPFCGKKLVHKAGKRFNRFYKGEPTIYQHQLWTGCLLDGLEVRDIHLDKWNMRSRRV